MMSQMAPRVLYSPEDVIVYKQHYVLSGFRSISDMRIMSAQVMLTRDYIAPGWPIEAGDVWRSFWPLTASPHAPPSANRLSRQK